VNRTPRILSIAVGPVDVALGLPVLDGDSRESVFAEAKVVGTVGEFTLAKKGEWLIGAAQGRPHEDPEQVGLRLYQNLLEAARGYELGRIWNYVPQINESGDQGLENYRGFCRGRSIAFEQAWGTDFPPRLPAASCVGTGGDSMSVVFAASSQPVQHFENPLQMSAYQYPQEYGPRSPSFARASRVGRDVFVSGTAAVRGHHSVSPSNTAAQLDCTLENLQAISKECGLGEDWGMKRATSRHIKIYLRHPLDFAAVSQRMTAWLCPEDHV